MEIGIKGTSEITVTEAMLAKTLGSGGLDVFATPCMIACMEHTCLLSVEDLGRRGEHDGRNVSERGPYRGDAAGRERFALKASLRKSTGSVSFFRLRHTMRRRRSGKEPMNGSLSARKNF